MTGFNNVNFSPVESLHYNFFINLYAPQANITIGDDVPIVWSNHKNGLAGGWDPLGANFRPNTPMVVVTQDEMWQPNLYTRKGTFHKQFGDKWISLGLKTETCVSATKDEVLLSIELYNRDTKDIDLELIPNQFEGANKLNQNNPFVASNDRFTATVHSDIKEITNNGFKVNIPAKSRQKYYFSVSFTTPSNEKTDIYQANLKYSFADAQNKTRETLRLAGERLPVFESENKFMQEFYYRSLLSVLMCRYERDNFLIKPFWSVGTWMYTISWDNSFASDIIAMLEPNSLRETLKLNFEAGDMKRTYIAWNGAFWDMLYIQEPFAQQIMIDAYINQTGDKSILNYRAGDATIYEWMKRWGSEFINTYSRKDGLIDIGYSTEKIIEIRTDGYNHVVPIVNILTLNLYSKLAQWGAMMNDKSAQEYARRASTLKKAIDEKLWNDEKGWYDNMYADGSKATIWTYHLFDALAVKDIDDNKRARMTSHIKEGVFLGEYGFYSIAKNDSIHWDKIDCDWGGGGQYAGMPGRIARNLYRNGNSELAWNILKRYAKYSHYFPYLTQNPSTDKPSQDISSMPLQIAAGAGLEAILFGVFGIAPGYDTLTISPNYHVDLGISAIRGYRYGDNSYDVVMEPLKFKVLRNKTLVAELPYGEKISFKR